MRFRRAGQGADAEESADVIPEGYEQAPANPEPVNQPENAQVGE